MRLRLSALILVFGCLVGGLAFSEEWRDRAWTHFRSIAEPLLDWGTSTEPRMDHFYASMIENLPVQERAERALQMSINQFEGASEYIFENAPTWIGQLERSERLLATIATARTSPRIDTRMASFEIALAMVELEKSSRDVDYLIELLTDDPKKNAGFALWHLAALGARGVDRDRIYLVLLDYSYHGDASIRRHGIDALGMFGGLEAIDPLLDIAGSEPLIRLRERALCGLAQCGTFHLIERQEALPHLVLLLDDPAQPAPMRPLVLQALREISGMHWLADDARTWQQELRKAGLI